MNWKDQGSRNARFRWWPTLIATTVLLANAGLSHAQSAETKTIAAGKAAPAYVEAFTKYDTALKAGDDAAAEQHGLTAWQASERELGDDRITGILAFNYGKLIVFKDTTRARLRWRAHWN